MARNLGPVCRLCRREGLKLFLKGERCYSDKCAIERRNYPPGAHGQARTRFSEFAIRLREKQKVRRIYGVLEAQFRNGFEKPEPVKPNEPVEYRVDLLSHDHVFRKGHRIMIQVQSTWFPIIDRNPQTFVPNIFEAKEADFQAATQRVFRSKTRPSAVILPVIQ